MTQNSEMAGQTWNDKPVKAAATLRTPRQAPRAKLDWILYVSLHSGNGGIVVDISEKGLLLQAADRVGATGIVQFRFLAPAIERVEVSAEFTWIDESRKRGGLRFIDLPEAAAEEIRRWIGQSIRGNSKAPTLEASKDSEEKPARARDTRIMAAQAPPQTLEAQPVEASLPLHEEETRVEPEKPAERSSVARDIDARVRALDPQVRAAEGEMQALYETPPPPAVSGSPSTPLRTPQGQAPASPLFSDVAAGGEADKRAEQSSIARAIDARVRALDPQLRAAEAETQVRSRRREADVARQPPYEMPVAPVVASQTQSETTGAPVAAIPDIAPSIDATMRAADQTQEPRHAPGELQARGYAASNAKEMGNLSVGSSFSALSSEETGADQRDGTADTLRKERTAAEARDDLRNENARSSTFGTLGGSFASAAYDPGGGRERALRGDFPERVRGLYALQMEDEEPPWHWSATLVVAAILIAALALLGFAFKVPIGREMVQLGQQISGTARSQSAQESAPPPPPGSESLPAETASGGAAQDAQANVPPPSNIATSQSGSTEDQSLQTGAANQEAQTGSAQSDNSQTDDSQTGGVQSQNGEAPSAETSSRGAGAPNGAAAAGVSGGASTAHENRATRRGEKSGAAEAWRYAQQHPRSASTTEGGAGAPSEPSDNGAANGATGSSEDNGEPELNLAQQYLGQGNSAGAAQVLWLAVEKGNPEAEVQLADLYGRGTGVRKNCEQARVLVEAAREKSDYLASNEAARLNALGCK